MDISPSALVNASTQMQQSQVAQTAQVLVLKKAMDSQAAGALALLQALPLATSSSFPQYSYEIDDNSPGSSSTHEGGDHGKKI